MEGLPQLIRRYEFLNGGRLVEARRFYNAWKLGLVGGDQHKSQAAIGHNIKSLNKVSDMLHRTMTRIMITPYIPFKPYFEKGAQFAPTKDNIRKALFGNHGPLMTSMYVDCAMVWCIIIPMCAKYEQLSRAFCNLWWNYVFDILDNKIPEWETMDFAAVWDAVQSNEDLRSGMRMFAAALLWCSYDRHEHADPVRDVWWSELRYMAREVHEATDLEHQFGYPAVHFINQFERLVRESNPLELDPVEIEVLRGGSSSPPPRPMTFAATPKVGDKSIMTVGQLLGRISITNCISKFAGICKRQYSWVKSKSGQIMNKNVVGEKSTHQASTSQRNTKYKTSIQDRTKSFHSTHRSNQRRSCFSLPSFKTMLLGGVVVALTGFGATVDTKVVREFNDRVLPIAAQGLDKMSEVALNIQNYGDSLWESAYSRVETEAQNKADALAGTLDRFGETISDKTKSDLADRAKYWFQLLGACDDDQIKDLIENTKQLLQNLKQYTYSQPLNSHATQTTELRCEQRKHFKVFTKFIGKLDSNAKNAQEQGKTLETFMNDSIEEDPSSAMCSRVPKVAVDALQDVAHLMPIGDHVLCYYPDDDKYQLNLMGKFITEQEKQITKDNSGIPEIEVQKKLRNAFFQDDRYANMNLIR